MDPKEQIQVNQSSLPTTIMTVMRYILTALGGLLLTKGILPVGTDVNAIIGSVLIVISTVYGSYKAWKNNEQKKTMEPYTPDSIATKK